MVGNIGETLDKISTLNFRDGDVLVCSYPKSGCHWVYNMIHMIRHKSLEYFGSPFLLEFDDLTQMNEFHTTGIYATHLAYPFIPERAKQGDVKLVNILRNPKDVFCSLYEYQSNLQNRLFKGDFEGCLQYFLSDGSVSLTTDLILPWLMELCVSGSNRVFRKSGLTWHLI
ncbi:sulfotransferase 4A1-like [Pecten maximus]|uniref:sulfotransferase 4A1-like n=1 Tax=Pecten maximus TaxID=6579 RepID=UPI0014585A35|nr:sulfotransferase 4A1-like [Pecten maximus]